jgi:alpha-D-ribose 1-methylphosphonate 5-triphosphate synthase subunit PhnG
MTDIPATELPRRLSALPPAEVQGLADALGREHTVQDVVLPQSGLGLLKLRDGALHDAYYLGEVPLARAQVIVRAGTGREAEGGALILDDRAQQARSFAILDAVYRAGLPGCERVRDLLARGGAALVREERDRRSLAAATKVDFALLSSSLEEEDE